MPQAIVFDLDGTLVHSAPDIQAALNAMLAREGIAPLSLDEVIGFIGNGLAVLVSRVIAHLQLDPQDHPRLMAETYRQMTENPAGLTALFAEVRPALEALRAKGHPIGLCTNKPEAAAIQLLHSLQIEDLFDIVVGGGRLEVLKPDPAPLLLTFELLGAQSGIFVGDSEVDCETAARAKADFVLFTEGYHHRPIAELPNRAVFDHFAALPQIIASL